MGVKQLWTLLQPVGRPVLLETMEGKALAIDSSIWIYQFQATMRDKEGRGLNNAHILGFLRRICKLIFYGIKPVFVFDGGAPALKRSTIIERKRRKAGAALSHAKVAERLLAAQLRREALSHVKSRQSATKPSTADLRPTGSKIGLLNEDTVYMEDLLPPVNSSPKKPEVNVPTPNPPESPKKYDWKDHDPYKLPDVDMKARMAEATRTADNGNTIAVDPRLATEDELRHFIDTMRPEDFDASSPAFRELPTETQYEIIGDLRLKSRQTSHIRLQTMLKSSKTAMDFSKAQIRGLHARNRLTQQLLMTTNTMGKEIDHHIMIPVRIAAERNREYVLIKNEGPSGGWSLGIKDEGTKEKPIQVQPDSDDDEDMEEVPINEPAIEYSSTFDSRRMALASIGKARDTASTSRHTSPPPAPGSIEKTEPLFTSWSDVDSDHIDDDIEPAMTAAIEESWQQQEERGLKAAIEASRTMPHVAALQSDGAGLSRPRNNLEWEDDEEHVLSHHSTNPPRRRHTEFEPPVIITNGTNRTDERLSHSYAENTQLYHIDVKPGDENGLVSSNALPHDKIEEATVGSSLIDTSQFFAPSPPSSPKPLAIRPQVPATSIVSVRLDRPILSGSPPSTPPKYEVPVIHSLSSGTDVKGRQRVQSPINIDEGEDDEDMEEVDLELPTEEKSSTIVTATSPVLQPVSTVETGAVLQSMDMDENEQFYEGWSRSPSAVNWMLAEVGDASNAEQARDANADADWDAAQEVDVEGEEGEFARFVSQVKGKDLDTVRDEIELEIKELHKAKKTHQRDSEEITQQMVAQIMLLLRLFGIPYITAPMEAEAQCATLLTLGLVEGVITDDSDVFLFGATRVFKNMFNQSKTVECFLASDLQRELGLTREKLIQLAYLLGSDYVDGLPKCGPVVAMEMLNEFDDKSGDRQDSLFRFKEWWSKVQTGRDKDDDPSSDFKKRFKKKFKDLHLSGDWPNPAVRDAYFHPTVDTSEEKFKWGLPDLDGLRSFLGEELRWSQTKVDDLLVPIIRKMGERSRNITSNRQSNLSGYFDASGGFGSGTMAPRKRQAYASKRLQQVVSDYRKKKDTSRPGTPGDNNGVDDQSLEVVGDMPGSSIKKVRGTGRKRTKSQTAAASKPRKRQKVVVEPESESEGEEGRPDEASWNRPLGTTLRARKARREIDNEDSDVFE